MSNRILKTAAFLIAVIFLSGFLTSCSDNFNKIPKTGFIAHYNHDKDNNTPFLSFWANGNEDEWNSRVYGKKGEKQQLFVKPVNTSYLVRKPANAEEKKGLNELTGYFKESLVSHLKAEEKKNSNFVLTSAKTNKCYTLEIAITSITPTNIKANVLGAGLGTLQGGTDMVVKGLSDKGHITIEGKLWDDKGMLIAEIADYQEDHPSILGVDLKNFKKYAHHKANIDVWCDKITEILTSPSGKKIRKKKFFLNPF